MPEKDIVCCYCISGCCCFALFVTSFAMTWYLMVKGNKELEKINPPDLDSFQQDWNKPLFTQIYSVAPNEKCNKSDFPIITMPWVTIPICYHEAVSF